MLSWTKTNLKTGGHERCGDGRRWADSNWNPWYVDKSIVSPIEGADWFMSAMQGAFAEHQVMLQKLQISRPIKIVLVRQAVDLDQCDGLIIPGGGT